MTPTLTMTDGYSRTADMPSLGSGTTHRIRRQGARPLAFTGTELAMAMSFTPTLPYWYEITIYRTNTQAFVLAIRLFHVSEDEKDQSDAWTFDTLPEVLDAIETYDAGRDVVADIVSLPSDAPAIELAARAMDLRARVSAARHHFAGLVGELFAELDIAAEAA